MWAFVAIFAHRGLPFVPIISSSKDGDKLAFLVKRLGYDVIRGSSTRGGARYLQALEMNASTAVVFAVDGQKGLFIRQNPVS